MLQTYNYPKYAFHLPPELAKGTTNRYPVVVVGAGPVGLAAAIDLSQSGVPVVLVDEDDTVSIGSRGVCYAKRTLEILDRLGVGDVCVNKGVTWNIGRTFFKEQEVYQFNLQPSLDQKRPGMINLQQYHLEEFLVQRAQDLDTLDLRFKSKVVSVKPEGQYVQVEIETPEGSYHVNTEWLIAADGARSPTRQMLGLDMEGKIFQDRFLIADVKMKADHPAERWFWFDPPFHPNQSVLLHKQADNLWRIDFQLGWDADPEEEKKPERVIPRIQAMFGDNREFDLEWVSVYTFQCRRMESFRHGRVFFVGDSAHQVSPFGARGANSGIQDTDNLCWKLKLVMQGKATENLLDSYNEERCSAADENILNSTRSTDFITPKSTVSRAFRNAALALSRHHDCARSLINSGRLSVPAYLTSSSLNTPDGDSFVGNMLPGAPMMDAPVKQRQDNVWLLDQLGGEFVLLHYFASDEPMPIQPSTQFLEDVRTLNNQVVAVRSIGIISSTIEKNYRHLEAHLDMLSDDRQVFQMHYDAKHGTTYLIRPDQHVCARWRVFDIKQVGEALQKFLA